MTEAKVYNQRETNLNGPVCKNVCSRGEMRLLFESLVTDYNRSVNQEIKSQAKAHTFARN